MFASNVHRLRMLGEIARRARAKDHCLSAGASPPTRGWPAPPPARPAPSPARPYLDWPSDLVFSAERARELPKERVLGIATGTQAEANAALSRLARGEHPALVLGPGDTVVLSSRVIPGNEPQAFAVMGDLLRRGVDGAHAGAPTAAST